MSKSLTPPQLSAILYEMHRAKDFSDDASYVDLDQYLANILDEDKKQQYRTALLWAEENPDFDFASILPGIRKTNPEIRVYLAKFKKFSKLF